jgi:hypothetical protein
MLTLFFVIGWIGVATAATRSNQPANVNVDGCILLAAFLIDAFIVLAGLYIVFVLGA